MTISVDNEPPGTIPRRWKVAFAVTTLMVVLAMIGVGLTTTNRDAAPKYWMSLVPVYGLLCAGVAWYRKRHGAPGRPVVQQVLHWLTIACAIWLDFYVRGGGQETGQAAGFTALLLLSLGCVLAGVYLAWEFAVVGVLLAATLMLAIKAEQYLWLVFVAGALAVVAMVWLMRVIARSHRKAAQGQVPANASVAAGSPAVGS